MLITVDTNLLIWGVRAVCTSGQEEMIPRSEAFLDWIDQENHKLALTATTVAEYLVGATAATRESELRILQARYPILPFDAKAAVIAGRLRDDKTFQQSLCNEYDKSRVVVKADIQIVATAKAHGVNVVYSNDRGLRAIAKRCQLTSRDLPTVAEMTGKELEIRRQRGLFDDERDGDDSQ